MDTLEAQYTEILHSPGSSSRMFSVPAPNQIGYQPPNKVISDISPQTEQLHTFSLSPMSPSMSSPIAGHNQNSSPIFAAGPPNGSYPIQQPHIMNSINQNTPEMPPMALFRHQNQSSQGQTSAGEFAPHYQNFDPAMVGSTPPCFSGAHQIDSSGKLTPKNGKSLKSPLSRQYKQFQTHRNTYVDNKLAKQSMRQSIPQIPTQTYTSKVSHGVQHQNQQFPSMGQEANRKSSYSASNQSSQNIKDKINSPHTPPHISLEDILDNDPFDMDTSLTEEEEEDLFSSFIDETGGVAEVSDTSIINSSTSNASKQIKTKEKSNKSALGLGISGPPSIHESTFQVMKLKSPKKSPKTNSGISKSIKKAKSFSSGTAAGSLNSNSSYINQEPTFSFDECSHDFALQEFSIIIEQNPKDGLKMRRKSVPKINMKNTVKTLRKTQSTNFKTNPSGIKDMNSSVNVFQVSMK